MQTLVAVETSDMTELHEALPKGLGPFAGKYTVERVLGQGGMGIVFEARHIRLGQRVAIKVLGSSLREYPELVERFEREARAAGSLTSAHAVRVFDIDATEDGTPFIVMELLAGRDLSTIVDRDGPQPVARSVRWLIEACEAIAEAHRLGIIHRDIKPSNLFLTDIEGRSLVKVLDFGIAKRVSTQETAITQAVAPLGTPQYMSPEQVRCAKDVDIRTDVWSLGVTLYELVCGQTPFAHESSSACIAAIAADPVPDPRGLRPDLQDEFVAVLMKALEKNANRRYQTVEELVAALAPFALDSSFDDEELVSAVRRAFVLSTSPKTPHEQATLDDADARAEEQAALSPAPVAVDLRLPFESRSDRTVPPAVSGSIAPPRSRLRSTLIVASAAVLGLATLVLSPRLVGSHDEAPRAAVVAPASVNVASLPAAVEIPTTAAPAPEPAAVAANVPAPIALGEATVTADLAPLQPQLGNPAPIARVAVAVGSSVLEPARRTSPKKAERAPIATTSAPRSGVHGGLSNPGF